VLQITSRVSVPGAESLSSSFQPATATPSGHLLSDCRSRRSPRAISAAQLCPRQGWKPVRVKTRQSRGFSEADSPVPKGRRPRSTVGSGVLRELNERYTVLSEEPQGRRHATWLGQPSQCGSARSHRARYLLEPNFFAHPCLCIVDSNLKHGKALLELLCSCYCPVSGRKLRFQSTIDFERVA
jgi:hypothetical protein